PRYLTPAQGAQTDQTFSNTARPRNAPSDVRLPSRETARTSGTGLPTAAGRRSWDRRGARPSTGARSARPQEGAGHVQSKSVEGAPPSMTWRLLPAASMAALLLQACAVGPNYRRPETVMTESFRGQEVVEPESLADLPWWEVFHDDVLQGLIV